MSATPANIRHDYAEGAFTLSGFLSTDECRSWIERGESRGFEPAPVQGTGGATIRTDARNNERVLVRDPDEAEKLWNRLWPHMLRVVDDHWRACGLHPDFRLYRYERFQQFKRHVDGRNEWAGKESRRTFMIYLNADFEGGFTDFYDFKVWPEEGMALVFDHALPHEGAMVTSSRKYVLRSDVLFVRD